tara:strand:+ start:1485 stop:1823 length:339 start_codon:yes stop_codon:yes gene_type:complete
VSEDEYPEPESMLSDKELDQILKLAADRQLAKGNSKRALLLLEDIEGCLTSDECKEPLPKIFEEPIIGFQNEVTTPHELLTGIPPRILYQLKAEESRKGRVVAAYYVEIWRG